MITNTQQREAWVQYLKSQASITGLLTDPLEIREADWKGEIFSYPNIRVQAVDVRPHINPNCAQSYGTVIISVFSEEKSSKQADQIAGAIANYIHGNTFTASGVKFWMVSVSDLIAAIAESDVVWKAEIHVSTLMS
jgi:hypothetical protein